MQNQKSLPLNYKRIVLGNFFASVLLAGLCLLKLDWLSSIKLAMVAFIAGVVDFSLLYVSMLGALRAQPQKSLVLMRKGMLRRFLFALIATLVAIKINFMPWAILLGILIGHVILLGEGIAGSLRAKNKLD